MIVAQDYQHIILPRMHLPGIQQIENMTNPAIMMSFANFFSALSMRRT